MNLSKTEKLLAARKRLKEFQLHKKQQPQGDQVPQHNIEGEITETSHPEKAEPVECIPRQNINNDCPEQSKNNHNLVPSAIFHKTSNSTEEIVSNIVDNVDNSLNYSPNQNERALPFLSPETSTVQKENLLQMVSAVSNVLTDTEECNVSNALDSDLEYRNQFLATCLEEQKQLVNQLHVQVSGYHSRVSELEAILVTKEAEFEARLLREISPLKEQLQIHAQTTGILIAEKAELTASLNQCQITVKQKSEELEDLLGKFKISQLRVNELEKELSFIKNNTEDTRKTFHQIQSEYINLEEKYNELRKVKEDLDLETSELKQKLNLKNTELINLQQELQEKSALLSLNELKLKQITNSSQELPTLEGQHHTVAMLEQQLNQTRDTLKAMNDEKEEASKQYQNYVRQLDTQISKLQQELEKRDKMIHEFESREQSYVQRLSDLEQKLQSERDKVENLIPLQNHREEIDSLNRAIHELNLEQERLHIMLSEKETDLESARKELSELQELNEQNVEAAKLAKALEGEQIGASRAVSQNQQLKQQLNEMHDAFVLLSNTKLDLTEQLQAERHIGRKLNIHLNKIEAEMDRLKEQLKEKEAALMELEKEKLQNAQITDQMQHYQAQSHDAPTLQEELQRALITIENLKRENKELSEVKVTMKNTQESISDCTGDTSEQAIKENGQCLNDIAIQTETGTVGASAVDYSNISEPMKKLEERFKETMEKVAELTDDKQRLEHLVLQLQSETETIGEYITLYQKQRSILQERAKEKEQTFQQLLEQRNHQQEQLHKLKVLVADLIKKKSHILNEISINADHKNANHEEDQLPQEHHQAIEESTLLSTTEGKNPTTSQILDLLAEIKDCKDASIIEPNFHPCPWCSGKLITV